jgi:hypothetical protein
MDAPDDSTAPSRSAAVLRRLITPWEYRHLHGTANVRFAAGGFTLGVGSVLLSLGRKAGTEQERRKCYGWAAFFLVDAALQFVGGFMDVAASRSAPPRT